MCDAASSVSLAAAVNSSTSVSSAICTDKLNTHTDLQFFIYNVFIYLYEILVVEAHWKILQYTNTYIF